MTTLETLLFLGIGYVLGYLQSRPIDPKTALTQVKLPKIPNPFVKPVPVGVLRRPTPDILAERNDPPKVKETKQAMLEDLRKIPELNQGR